MFDFDFPINESNLQINFVTESVVFVHCNISLVVLKNGILKPFKILGWAILPRFNTEKCDICGERFKNHDRCNLAIVYDNLNPYTMLMHETCYKLATLKRYF